MARKSKINWVWIAVILGCAAFLGYQYFMVNENAERIVMEKTQRKIQRLKMPHKQKSGKQSACHR